MSSKACITETQRKMSSKACKRVNSTPDNNDKSTMTLKHTRVSGNRKRVAATCSFQLPKNTGFSPMNFLWRLSANVVRALRFVSLRRRRTSPKVSASSLGRPRSYVSPNDSHRTETIEDCIKFINSSSSSLGRSRSYVSPTASSLGTEAIEDCIEFIISSSSFQRSTSPNDSHRTEAIEDCIKFINSSSSSLGRSRSYVSPTASTLGTEAIEDCIEFIISSSSFQRSNSPNDSHRTEVIEDCIEFIISSSSFQRSNSSHYNRNELQ